MALHDPPLVELVIAIGSWPDGLLVDWRVLDHGPYPGPPPHPYQPPRPPVLVDHGGHQLPQAVNADIDQAAQSGGRLVPHAAEALFRPLGAAATHLSNWPQARVSLDLGDLASRSIRWEDAVADVLGTGPITIVRRGTHRLASTPSLPYDFRAYPDRPGSIAETLDDWTLGRARRAGGLVIHDAGDPSPVDILHIAIDDGSFTDPVVLVDWDNPPQLVGLWWPPLHHDFLEAEAMKLLSSGAGAVVGLASHDDRRAQTFFHHLYRKVFHDVPIDVAVQESRERAQLQEPDRLIVTANPGGETSLLLTRAAMRAVRHWSPPPPVERITRSERMSAELEAPLTGRLREFWEEGGQSRWDDLATAEFGAEEHDLVLTTEISRSIESLAPEESGALADLRSLDPEELRTATTRLLQAWVQHEGETVPSGSPLSTGGRYHLSVQVAPVLRPDAAGTGFPDAALAEIFRSESHVALEVCFFAVDDDVAIEGPAQAEMSLPRVGTSSIVGVAFRPRRSDATRIRITVAYRGVLLQSVVLHAGEANGLRLEVDYVASTDLALLDELDEPVLSIFTNRSEDGSTHWVGVFGTAGAVPELVSGQPTVISDDDLERASTRLRARLGDLAGAGAYAYAEEFATETGEPERRRGGLVQLAVEGYTLWDQLLGANSPTEQLASRPAAVLGQPGVVTIARCNKNATRSVPWAALYDFHLDDSGRRDADDVPADIGLCDVYDGAIDSDPHFLDDAAACYARANCPLRDPARRSTTVCPFGFLGVRYQIEQPLQHVTPTPVGEVPPELAGQLDQTSFLTVDPAAALSMALAVAPDVLDGRDHAAELAALTGLDIMRQDDYSDVLDALKKGGTHFHYFYCHGETGTGDLRLRLGPVDNPGWLSVGNLSDPQISWPPEPRPLVFLNGCQTAAVIPETSNKFLLALRRLGASGVLGTEIEVFNVLARQVGVEMLQRFLAGESLGEAMQAVRLGLLRSRNPLGLIFTVHGLAALHLHSAVNCSWCVAHPGRRAGGLKLRVRPLHDADR